MVSAAIYYESIDRLKFVIKDSFRFIRKIMEKKDNSWKKEIMLLTLQVLTILSLLLLQEYCLTKLEFLGFLRY